MTLDDNIIKLLLTGGIFVRTSNYKLRLLLIFLVALFSLLLPTNISQAATISTVNFSNTVANGDYYQTEINFQLSNEDSQLILYSPDYNNLDIPMLKSELGKNNVIENANKKQVLINLKDKMDQSNSGSFLLTMKKSDSDIVYIRDIDNNELANENLVTEKAVDSKVTFNALQATNLMTNNDALTTDNTVGALPSRADLTKATTSAEIYVEPVTVSDIDQDLTVHGTWKSTANRVTLYYRFNSSGSVPKPGADYIPGIEKWGTLGTFTGTAGAVNNFTATIPSSTMKALTSGSLSLYTNYVDPKAGDLGNPYRSVVTNPPYAKDLKILNNGVENNTSISNPYIARGTKLTLSGSITTNTPGTLKFVVDDDETNAPSLNLTIPGINSSYTQSINLSNLGKDDSKVHEAVYEYIAGGKVLAATKYYFVVGNELKLTVPQTIDFGSHMYTDFINGFTATPDVNGELAIFDGRTGNYSGNIGLMASATPFRNAKGDKLSANLSWDGKVIPDDGTGVKVGEVTPPTAAEPAYQNFTQNLKNDLKFTSPKGTGPQGGNYTSTLTWTVDDTLK